MGTNNKTVTYLSYLGILALIPFFAEKDDEFVQYHAKQGLNLFICEVAILLVFNLIVPFFFEQIFVIAFYNLSLFLLISGVLTLISFIVWLAFISFSIIGMINVSKGLMQPLPFLGKIQFIK